MGSSPPISRAQRALDSAHRATPTLRAPFGEVCLALESLKKLGENEREAFFCIDFCTVIFGGSSSFVSFFLIRSVQLISGKIADIEKKI